MKKLILLTALLLSSSFLWAQETASHPGSFQSQYAKLYKAYAARPNDVACLVDMAQFYSQKENPMCNYAMAMKYIRQAEERYVSMVEDQSQYREVTRLIKKKVTVTSVRQLKQHIIEAARQYVSNSENIITIAEMDNLVSSFKGDAVIMKNIDSRRLSISLETARKENTLNSLYEFVQKYGTTIEGEEVAKEMGDLAAKVFSQLSTEEEVDNMAKPYQDIEGVKRAAIRRKSTIAYSRALEVNTTDAYRAFIAAYPSGDEYMDALDNLDGLLAMEFAALEDPQEIVAFIQRNEDNQLTMEAMKKLRQLIREKQDVAAAKLYLTNFQREADYNEILRLVYDWHIQEGNSNSIEHFMEEYPNVGFQAAVEEELRKARMKDEIDLTPVFQESMFPTYTSYIYKLTGKKVSYVALQRTLQQLIAAQNWKGAMNRIGQFELSFDGDCEEEVAELRSILSAPVNKKRQLAVEVCPNYHIQKTAVHPDGKTMYYTRISGNDTTIAMANRVAGKGYRWKSVGNIHISNLDNKGLTVYSLYDNGKKMLLGNNGDILIAEGNGLEWRVVENPSYPVNTDYYDYDAFMVPDGSGMLIASDRPYGHNFQTSGAYFHGARELASDIYFIPKTQKGWGRPINLGLNINSSTCDHSPVLSKDLKTLYFITDSRGGLGYGDVYMATRDNVEVWDQWSTPVNYGKETNTGLNECSVSLFDNERSLMICSNQKGSFGCYSVASAHDAGVGYVRVSLVSVNEMTIDVYDEATNSQVAEHSISGNIPFGILLYSDKKFAVMPRVDKQFFAPSAVIVPTEQATINMRSFGVEELKVGCGSIPLPAIGFESNHKKISPIGQRELDNIAQFAIDHPEFSKIEFIVNVKGSNDQQAFQQAGERAQAIKRYLITKGLDEDRIVISNYGNSNYKTGQPIADVSILF